MAIKIIKYKWQPFCFIYDWVTYGISLWRLNSATKRALKTLNLLDGILERNLEQLQKLNAKINEGHKNNHAPLCQR